MYNYSSQKNGSKSQLHNDPPSPIRHKPWQCSFQSGVVGAFVLLTVFIVVVVVVVVVVVRMVVGWVSSAEVPAVSWADALVTTSSSGSVAELLFVGDDVDEATSMDWVVVVVVPVVTPEHREQPWSGNADLQPNAHMLFIISMPMVKFVLSTCFCVSQPHRESPLGI